MSVVTRDDLEASLADFCTHVGDPRAGLFGPGSAVWELAHDVGVFLGGGRAALLQLAHPMVAHAIDHHSRTRADVAGRFRRTFEHVYAMVFGDLDAALTAARRVHRIHARVHGEIRARVGGWAAGARYHANDAAALRWVHATLVDTTLAIRALLDGAPVAPPLRDRYVAEMNRFAALFGIPRALWPASAAAHDAYMAEMLASDRIAVAPCAREMAAFLVGRGGPGAQPALGRVAEAVTHALLPPRLAAAFALRGAPRRTRAGLAAFVALYRRLPRAAIELPAYAAARARCGGAPPSRLAPVVERLLDELAARTAGGAAARPVE